MRSLSDLRLALYQPDIPQNAGTLLRLSACLNVAVDIIEPCGFVFDDRKLRRAGMDYLSHAAPTVHRAIPDSIDSFSERAGQVTSVLDGILQKHPHFPPPVL